MVRSYAQTIRRAIARPRAMNAVKASISAEDSNRTAVFAVGIILPTAATTRKLFASEEAQLQSMKLLQRMGATARS